MATPLNLTSIALAKRRGATSDSVPATPLGSAAFLVARGFARTDCGCARVCGGPRGVRVDGWLRGAPGAWRSFEVPGAANVPSAGANGSFGFGDLGKAPPDRLVAGLPRGEGFLGGVDDAAARRWQPFETCSEDDVFEASSITGEGGALPVITWANFEGFWTDAQDQPRGRNEDHAIADTTAQRTTETVWGGPSLFEARTYPSGSLRMYLSAKTPAQIDETAAADMNNEMASEYSLVSTNGLDFELELRFYLFFFVPVPRLGQGEAQAESYVDDDGTVWMYYTSGLPVDAIYFRTSRDGVDFGTEDGSLGVETNLNEPTVGKKGLTGLSVVNTDRISRGGRFSQRGYRGYFSNEINVAQMAGTIFAATSRDLQSWETQPPGGNVGDFGEVIGDGSNGPLGAPTIARQPFALKRNDPDHPSCVTLFYWRPGTYTQIWYSTAPDGVSFNKETYLDLGDIHAAGPTIVPVRGLEGWEWVRHADPPYFLLYTDGRDDGGNNITQAHVLRKA